MIRFIKRQGCLLKGIGIVLILSGIGYWIAAYWLTALGCIIVAVSIKNLIEDYISYWAMMRWIRANEGRKILFYAGRKRRQKQVENYLIPVLSDSYLRTYYEGSNLKGDIPLSIVIELMNTYGWRFNQPLLARILKQTLYQTEVRDELDGFIHKDIGQEGFISRITAKENSLDYEAYEVSQKSYV